MTEKQFIADDEELMSEWDRGENAYLNPERLTRGSNKRVSWICKKCDHRWSTSIYHRATKGGGCPKCRHSKRKNYNSSTSLQDTHPEIAANWHPTANRKFTIDAFTRGSRFEAHWQCKACGFEWECRIQRYNDCSECKKSAKIAQNNLAKNHPELLEEWDYSKNKTLPPENVSYSSSKSAWWKCSKCGYEWEARISNRAVLKRGCPFCANKVVVRGGNDLCTTHPELANEWHLAKNDKLNPHDVTYGSGQKVWWICSQGHEFEATILHRSHGTGCPYCHSGRQTSFAEQATFFYVKKLYPDAISRFTAGFLGRMELDIFIPSINYAIEYDGEAWHKKDTIKREQKKYQLCRRQGIKLIRLREKMPELASDIADYMYSTEKLYEPKMLSQMLAELLKRINFSSSWMLGSPVDINIERDRFEIQQYRTIMRSGSMAEKYPDIAKEWHPDKNEKLTAEMFKPASDQKVWWKCSACGHEYLASIGHRTSGTGCPPCGVEKVTAVKRKAVNMIDPATGNIIETFISISDASRKMKVNSSNITMVCKEQRRMAGGFVWTYA